MTQQQSVDELALPPSNLSQQQPQPNMRSKRRKSSESQKIKDRETEFKGEGQIAIQDNQLIEGFDEIFSDNLPKNSGLSVKSRHPDKFKLPKKAVSILKTWFLNNIEHPYPTGELKETFSTTTGLTKKQIENWFINTRKVSCMSHLTIILFDLLAEVSESIKTTGGERFSHLFLRKLCKYW